MLDFQTITLLLTGLVAGVLGGALGIGGSIIMIPAMTLICDQSLHLAQGAAMMINVCVALPAAVRHLRAKAVIPAVVRAMIPAAAIAVLAGVAVGNLEIFSGTGERLLEGIFGAFLVYVAVRNFTILLHPKQEAKLEASDGGLFRPALGGSIVGGLAGFTGGLLGVGGGVVAVPAQQLFLRIPIRNAVANSAATMVCLSLIGATYKNHHLVSLGIPLSEALRLAALLLPGAVLGAYLGAGLTHTIPTRYVRTALILIVLFAAGTMLLRAFQDA